MCRTETANVLSKNLGEYLILLTDPAKIGILHKKVKLFVKKEKKKKLTEIIVFLNFQMLSDLSYLIT